MLLLGHTGITLGVVWIGDCLRQGRIVPTLRSGVEAGLENNASEAESPPNSAKRPRVRVDYRLVLLGAMVPDIMDKLLGLVFLRAVFSNGRIFSHTLAFALTLTMLGFLLYAIKRKPWAIILGIGSSVHLVLDQMWRSPATLLWPAYGWTFQRGDVSGWLSRILNKATHDPGVYLWEVVGAGILALFLLGLILHHRISDFVRGGMIYD